MACIALSAVCTQHAVAQVTVASLQLHCQLMTQLRIGKSTQSLPGMRYKHVHHRRYTILLSMALSISFCM